LSIGSRVNNGSTIESFNRAAIAKIHIGGTFKAAGNLFRDSRNRCTFTASVPACRQTSVRHRRRSHGANCFLAPVAARFAGYQARRARVYLLQSDRVSQTTRVLKFRSTTSVRADEQSSYLRRLDHLLRQTGIDGLPMLINVLRGEISIVGPCSYATPAQFYDSWDTCNTPKAIQRQIEHDLFYVAN
jgi:Bacterial sugar transferase